MTSDVADTVRRYFSIVADLGSTEDELRSIVHPEAHFTEHPNAVSPAGATKDRDQSLSGFRSGKALLAEQRIEIHDVLVDGERAAVRATWRGTVGVDAGPFTKGTELVAALGSFLRIRDGRVVEHETYDCYQPFGS
jgi:ketosteroid isomerase-like protein